jgi:hypothetical protein
MPKNNTVIKPPAPQIFTPWPVDGAKFNGLANHVKQIRSIFDWPGVPYHDDDQPADNKFNRWQWHNLPWLRALHHSPSFIVQASELAGEELKPSYVFLSMYGEDGVCPNHVDRPQCRYTVDLVIDQDAVWPIYVGEHKDTPLEECKGYQLEIGQALFYSGTDQLHYRHVMSQDSKATFCDLAFFHFCPVSWMGEVR